MDPFVGTHGSVGGLDMAEWSWADVVVRGRAPHRPGTLDIREPPRPCERSLRTPSPQENVRKNLSTSPLEDQPGQVDRLVSAFSRQEKATGDAISKSSPIIEDGLCVARGWIEALAKIHPGLPPADVPLRRWMQLIDDIARFVDGELIHKATRLGWTALDLFGCDREKPFARIDRQGLCWLIAGNRLIDLSENGAIIETWTGARQTWNRKPSELGRVLPWDLKPDSATRWRR
jgi:hypothetical protein